MRQPKLGTVGRIALSGALFGGLSLAIGLPATGAGATTSTTLYASPTASATTPCTEADPCSLSGAVTTAEASSGAVTIELESGTYTSQVTIAPETTSPMTSLTVIGPSSGSPAIIQPKSLTQNVTEGSTGAFFDDLTGNVAAIVGVQTGSMDTAAGNTTAGKDVAVSLEDVTVSGSALNGLPPGGELAGIAFVDTPGSIVGDSVESIEQANAMGQSAVHGIEVKSTATRTTPNLVTLSKDTVKNEAGHVDISLQGSELLASVSGSTLVGNPTTTLSPDVAQFGITAADLAGLTIAHNTIENFQSPWGVGGVWLDALASKAACLVSHNRLLGNDNGVELHGASGCSIEDNEITAGSAGIELGPSYTGSPASSNDDSIAGNVIEGTTTISTTTVTTNGASTTAAIAEAPVDGVLVWDGTGTMISGNSLSGFVHDVYAGQDPIYENNTATWGSSSPSYVVSETSVTPGNRIVSPAAANVTSGITSDGLVNTSGQQIDAQGNWWGSPYGAAEGSGGSGRSAGVNSSNWCITVACPSVPSAPRGLHVQRVSGPHDVRVSWRAPVTDGGLPVERYRITPFDRTTHRFGRPAVVGGKARSVIMRDLTARNRYVFVVVAINARGSGPSTTSRFPVFVG